MNTNLISKKTTESTFFNTIDFSGTSAYDTQCISPIPNITNNIIQFPYNLNINEYGNNIPELTSTLIIDDAYIPVDETNTIQQHNKVEPFTEEEILIIKNYFYNSPSRFKHTNMRNYAYFILSINCGKRAGDILNLRIGDIINIDGSFKTHIQITSEQKTGKYSKTLFVPNAQIAIAEYLNLLPSYKRSDFLFQNYKTGDAITVGGMRKMMKKMAKNLSIPHNVGTHSNRKTFATLANKNNPNNTRLISKILCHTKPETTEAYIISSQFEQDRFMLNNQL